MRSFLLHAYADVLPYTSVPFPACRDLSDPSGAARASSIACCGHEPRTAITCLAFQPDGHLLVCSGVANAWRYSVARCCQACLARGPGGMGSGS